MGKPFLPNTSHASTWIWYPGDFEIWLSNKMQVRRTEREAVFPPLWQYYSPYPLITFQTEVDIPEEDEVKIYSEGTFQLLVDDVQIYGVPESITIPSGKHKISFKVYNQEVLPAIYVDGKYVKSNETWIVTNEDKLWIDETGKAQQSGTPWVPVGSWNFNSPENKPSEFRLTTEPWNAKKTEKVGTGELVDFGKETFGYIKIHGLKGKGKLSLYYGESREEALDSAKCETLDYLHFDGNQPETYTHDKSKAFRYVQVQADATVEYDSISMLYEYLPLEYRGAFKSSDEVLNKIWDVSAYTMHLTTREFFIDGIKRDRWVWSGDAYQSYLMNYYLFFDSSSVERTLLALRGKDPVTAHVNIIMDYSFYWFVGIYDYYLYTGDTAFIKTFYPRMKSLMEFCLGRRNENGFLEPLDGDWVFIDWADGLPKKGEVSFEQMLLARSLEAMAVSAEIAGENEDQKQYQELADDLKEKLFDVFWDEEEDVMKHQRIDGEMQDIVTKYANMFGIFFNYFNEEQKESVKNKVLLNDDILQITTPYMRFYELEALCAMGEQKFVLDEIRDYWGGMLELGATSFWEKYDPKQSGGEHLEMYGRPYGKSLCHAWGASPIYLFGKYYLGVEPTAPGYSEYVVKPNLGGLKWIEGKVPTPNGSVDVYCSTDEIKVKASEGEGTLIIHSISKPEINLVDIKSLGSNKYEIKIKPNTQYSIQYKAL
ncbi:alpha-L-rhamnosidase C-terminal domain-containing protein [Mariniflexile litorale]|uniref:Alpha-L-rhamnosidase C-terminal domain-containing protein n=1 Tax=Mariniflexile litorale TaxID=3045158 RepID=A0AAU7ECD8_9FLAO|nr:alpha-L-rhamnosidase C-terminal domain-containing protein [Mariniflexile sp. KMM 9835]MDQ8210563.1 alpha-L-rhamnosidase C-terminal domain-containing protein [Mariniflexile sp. KMM 9835]